MKLTTFFSNLNADKKFFRFVKVYVEKKKKISKRYFRTETWFSCIHAKIVRANKIMFATNMFTLWHTVSSPLFFVRISCLTSRFFVLPSWCSAQTLYAYLAYTSIHRRGKLQFHLIHWRFCCFSSARSGGRFRCAIGSDCLSFDSKWNIR